MADNSSVGFYMTRHPGSCFLEDLTCHIGKPPCCPLQNLAYSAANVAAVDIAKEHCDEDAVALVHDRLMTLNSSMSTHGGARGWPRTQATATPVRIGGKGCIGPGLHAQIHRRLHLVHQS